MMRKITDSMSLISQFDLINKNIFFINTAVYKYKLQFVYDRHNLPVHCQKCL